MRICLSEEGTSCEKIRQARRSALRRDSIRPRVAQLESDLLELCRTAEGYLDKAVDVLMNHIDSYERDLEKQGVVPNRNSKELKGLYRFLSPSPPEIVICRNKGTKLNCGTLLKPICVSLTGLSTAGGVRR